jgi:predicted transcriptional regulator
MADDQDGLGAKLDILIKLQAGALVRGMESKKEKIIFLDSAGLPPKLIAELVGTTPASVSQTLYAERKKGKDAKGEG